MERKMERETEMKRKRERNRESERESQREREREREAELGVREVAHLRPDPAPNPVSTHLHTNQGTVHSDPAHN